MIGEILTIGDEILRGEIVDSNKAYLAEQLLSLEVECHHQVSVRDDPADMSDALTRAVQRSDVVLVSGGLGPTRDDLTTKIVGSTFGRELAVDESSLEAIRAFFRRVGREMAENNAKQAYFPLGAEILPNPVGTAPGFMVEEQGTLIFCLPGVPRELHLMMVEQVLPRLATRLAPADSDVRVMRATILRTFGIGESSLDAELKDLASGPGLSLGFRTAFPDNYLRPVARAATEEAAEERLANLVAAIRERLGCLLLLPCLPILLVLRALVLLNCICHYLIIVRLFHLGGKVDWRTWQYTWGCWWYLVKPSFRSLGVKKFSN